MTIKNRIRTALSFAAVLAAASGANAQTINLNVKTVAEDPETDLAGPAGGAGEVWDQRASTFETDLQGVSTAETDLQDKYGLPTNVGYTFTVSGTMAGPWNWTSGGDPDLGLIASGMANFYRGVNEPQQFVINGLVEGDTFDVWIASSIVLSLFPEDGEEPSNQRSKGEWSTPNVTTTVGSQTIDNTLSVNATTWEEGNNYVRFEGVVVDANGELVFDGFSIDEIPTFDNRLPVNGFQLVDLDPTPPEILSLRVNTVSGEITLLGHETAAFDINYYELTSELDSLDSGGWNSLTAQAGFPAATPGMGDGWEEGGMVGAHGLAEGYLLGSSEIAAGATVSLGTAYDTGVDAQDLEFKFRTDSGLVITLPEEVIEYFDPPPGEPGDFDVDGDVDGADFLLWQRDPDVGALGDWQDNFGTVAPPLAAAASAVPEPASLALIGLGGLMLVRRRRWNCTF